MAKKQPATAPKSNGNRVKVQNNIELDGRLPIPKDFDSGGFVSVNGQPYIPFFAPGDDQFKKFLVSRLLSPTQASCIGDKTFYSVGDGLQVREQEFPKDFDKKINGKRQRLDDILKLIFDAYWQDGNKFIEVVRLEVGGTRYVHVYEHSNLDCRLEEPEDGSEPTHVLRSRSFRRHGIYHYKDDQRPVRIPLWSDDPLLEGEVWARDPEKPGVERTVFHIKNEVSGVDGYGLPSNFAGLLQVALEYKASRFNLDNFRNNMFLGGILMIQGNLSPEEEKKLTQNLRKLYTGDGTAGRILPLTAEGGITDSKFLPFSESHEGHFIELDKRVEEKIIGANQWSKELMDLKNQSGLGKGGDYLKTLFKAKYKTIIAPAQENVMNNFVWPLLQIIDEWKDTQFASLPWYIQPSIPVAFEGELDVNSLLTVDEGREELGKKPFEDERGRKLIKEIGPAGAKAAAPEEEEKGNPTTKGGKK